MVVIFGVDGYILSHSHAVATNVINSKHFSPNPFINGFLVFDSDSIYGQPKSPSKSSVQEQQSFMIDCLNEVAYPIDCAA